MTVYTLYTGCHKNLDSQALLYSSSLPSIHDLYCILIMTVWKLEPIPADFRLVNNHRDKSHSQSYLWASKSSHLTKSACLRTVGGKSEHSEETQADTVRTSKLSSANYLLQSPRLSNLSLRCNLFF